MCVCLGAFDLLDSPLHSVAALSWFLTGDDSDYAYAPAATSAANTLPLFFQGEKAGGHLESQKSRIQLSKLWQGSRAERGDEVEKEKGDRATWTEGGVNKAPLSPGRSLPRGRRCLQSWGTTAEINHEPNFLTHQQDLRRNWFNTPPQSWQEVSLFTVAIETGIGSLHWCILWFPFSGWEIRQLSHRSKVEHGPKTSI